MMMVTEKTKCDIIRDYFSGRNVNRFNILDIGTNDTKYIDPLLMRGCGAYLVQPSPDEFDKLKCTYESNDKVKCFPFAITNKNGIIDFIEKDNEVFSENVEELEETIRRKTQAISVIKVMSMDFYSFTVTTENNKFDMISVNAGGDEYDILSQIDLDQARCEILVINHNGKYKDMYERYIEPFDLGLVFEDSKTLIFTR